MPHNERISVLIVDDFPVIRCGLRHFLEAQRIRVSGEADSIEDALSQARSLEPDVILVELALPDGTGVDAVRELTKDKPRRVVAFSIHETWDRVEAFMNAGGAGFVSKRCPAHELPTAIGVVADDRQWISPRVRRAIPTKRGEGASLLSGRENEVTTLVARGLTTRQIADQLCVSPKTVETHRYRIYKKLNIQSRSQLVNYAIEHGLLGTIMAESTQGFRDVAG